MVNKSKSITATRLAEAKRLVLKIGSSLFVNSESGELDREWLEELCVEVAEMHQKGQEVIIVSSGAIALGATQLGVNIARARLEESQAAAAAGQIQLAHAYQEILGRHSINAAQILLTLDDSESRRRYLNAASTLFMLLKCRAVPIVNENDTVATQEIRYGDNDRLAARVAQMVSADCLVLLSDVDGLYTSDPRTDSSAEHIPEITELKREYWDMAGGPGSNHGSGGMQTKLDAARIAMGAGCRVLIAPGQVTRPIEAMRNGGRVTWFLPSSTPRAARKQWIAGTLQPKGDLFVDDGAKEALVAGKSLLPAGIPRIGGEFDRGDAVRVVDHSGSEIGRGLCAYGAADARAIAGRHSNTIASVLDYHGRDEMIHRDDLVLTEADTGT